MSVIKRPIPETGAYMNGVHWAYTYVQAYVVIVVLIRVTMNLLLG